MITCPKCAKENQEHYKFCLGCGAELPRDAAPRPFTANTPSHGVAAQGHAAPAPAYQPPAPVYQPPAPTYQAQPQPTYQPQPVPVYQPQPAPMPAAPAMQPVAYPPALSAGAVPVAAPAPAAPAAPATSPCPQCAHPNGPNNLFCGSCGYRLTKTSSKSSMPAAAAPAAPAASNVILTALRADGSEAGSYALPNLPQVFIGRETGNIFASDSYLSPRHASFTRSGSQLIVRDEGSLNGVYRKLARDVPVELQPNDVFRIGQEIIRFEPIQQLPPSPDGVERLGSPAKGYVGRIALIIGRETTGNAFPVPEVGMHLGRERGDVLFPEDGYVSGLHCRLAWDKGRLFLTDLGSSNGTFIRLRQETEVHVGDVLLMGQQLFRLSL